MIYDKKICECGHHKTVHHVSGCAPWRKPEACSCRKFKHVPEARAGVDKRPSR